MPRRIPETESKDSPFQFVTISRPEDAKDKEKRRLVRKFVMKRIGEARKRASANPTFEVIFDPWCLLGSGGRDPFVRYPLQLSDTDRLLIAYVFRDHDGTMRPMRHVWFPLGYDDPATLHIILSNSASHLDVVRNPNGWGLGSEEAQLATRHYALALKDIRTRLAAPNVDVTDGLIGAVGGLLCHETATDLAAWAIHMQGMWSLVRRRGGLHAINDNVRILLSWSELRGIYPQDCPPVFPLPDEWSKENPTRDDSAPVSHPLLKLCRLTPPMSSQWPYIYEQLLYCSEQCEKESVRTNGAHWLTNVDCGGWTNVIVYRLLRWRPLHQDPCNPLAEREEMLRLAALLYIAPIWRKFGQFPARTRTLVDKLLRGVKGDESDWDAMWMFKVWLMYMGVMEAEDREVAADFARELASLARARRLGWSDGVMHVVKSVLWLPSALNGTCKAVKEAVERAFADDALMGRDMEAIGL